MYSCVLQECPDVPCASGEREGGKQGSIQASMVSARVAGVGVLFPLHCVMPPRFVIPSRQSYNEFVALLLWNSCAFN